MLAHYRLMGFIYLFLSILPLSTQGYNVSYGTLYIKNNSPYTIMVAGKLKDSWGTVSEQTWDIPSKGQEVIGQIDLVSDLSFTGDFPDPAQKPSALEGKQAIDFEKKADTNDLLVYIGINQHTGAWLVQPEYQTSTDVLYGGPTGYYTEQSDEL